jgi:hypothetical protein
MRLERYMQPIGVHRTHEERLLLHDEEGRCYLWAGEADGEPSEIPNGLAHYLLHRREMLVLAPHQRMWFGVSDLPLRADIAAAKRERPEREYLV